jgi:serine/threonine protein kinase/Flp pilus assembly protein TadD
MQSLICRVCGASNSVFDSQCASCGASLPDPTGTTWVNGKERPHDDDELQPGQEISHFRILGRLGKGGMGKVYRALDLSLDRVVALKFLLERRRRNLVRLEREAKALAKIDHPNIGTIYDFHESDGHRFIVMALYDGETLATRLARQPDHRLPIPEAAAITSQLANALQAAHAANLVHRDLKPENVMILPDGRVKLIDFGLARWPESARLTLEGHIAGTPDYMAPEQFDEDKVVGRAADLWALGVVLYEMIAGRHPFDGKGMGKVQAIINEKPFPLRKACPEVPAALEKIVERCLVKDPLERCSSAGNILAELEDSGLLGSGTVVPPARPAWQRWMIVGATVLLVALAVFILIPKPPRTVYVAVLKPVVTGTLQTDDKALVEANLQASLLRTVAVLDGLAALDPDQVNKETGNPAAIARALGAGEVVTSQADCAGDLCKVSLSRLAGRDGRVLWTEVLQQQLPPSKPQLFAEAVAAALRQGYGDHKLRVPRLELEIREEDYRTYLELRNRAEVPGALKEVLDGLGALRKRAPAFVEVYSLEANVARRLYTSSGDKRYLERGIAVARQARQRAPGDSRPLSNLFYLYLDAGRYPEAETVLEQLKDVDPAGSMFEGGMLAERQGHPQEALTLMAEATRLRPSWRALLMLANHEYDQGQLDEAQSHYEELLRRVPGKPEGLKGLAVIEMQRNPRQAIPILRDLAARAPDGATFNNLGVALLLERRYVEAEESSRRAVKLQPDSPANALNLADCLTLLNRSEDARPLYLDIVAKADRTATPGNWEILSIKAQALAHLGDSTHAVEVIQQALRVAPNSPQLAGAAAVVYTLAGAQETALRYARLATPGALENPFLDPLQSNPTFQKLRNGHH